MSFWSFFKNWLSGYYSEWAQNVNNKSIQDTGHGIDGVEDPFGASFESDNNVVNVLLHGLTGSKLAQSIFGGLASVLDPIGKANRDFTHSENELAFQRQLKIMDYQNEYNTPEAQMARLKAAGLNPNLMYGEGTTGNTGNLSPQYQPTKSELSYNALERAAGAIGLYHNIKLQKVQIDNLMAQADLTKQKEFHEFVKTQMDESKQTYFDDMMRYQMEALKEHSRNLGIKNNMLAPKEKYSEAMASLEFLEKKFGLNVAKLKSDLANDGMTERDATWIRLLLTLANESRRNNSTYGPVWEKLKKYWNDHQSNAKDALTPEDRVIWDELQRIQEEEEFRLLHGITD